MTVWDEEHRARAVLSAVCTPGDRRLVGLLQEHPAPEAVAALRHGGGRTPWSARAIETDEEDLAQRAENCGLEFLIPGDECFPSVLSDLDNCDQVNDMGGAPLGLWVAGDPYLLIDSRPRVAVVGARAATRYGEAIATDMTYRLAGQEFGAHVIISGGAYGIDAAAHRGAIAAGGTTIGVYAGGLDEPYPRGNHNLFEAIRAEHVAISEAAPGVRCHRMDFLARNRLIAALGQGVVVVEAAMRSGARNTTSWAIELSRPVMAVPGSVHSSSSTGCHQMIRDGKAVLVTDARDVAAVLAPMGRAPMLEVRGVARALDGLDARLTGIREAMPARGGVTSAELAVIRCMGIQEVMAGLAELEARGLVRRRLDGSWQIQR